jgi:galactonate dehydratase
MCALSAIDQALWDIAGKVAGLPVHRLLGGPYRDRVRVYLNQWYRGAQSREDLVQKAQAAVAQGGTALKWYPFRFLPQLEPSYSLSPKQIRLAVDEVQAIRQAVGPEVDLMVDVWRRLDLTSAAQFCHAIEELNLLFVEEPVAGENPEVLCELSRSTRVRLAAGERLFSRSEFRPIVERQAVGIIQPAVLRVGGITEAWKIAAMAETYVIGVAPHNPVGPIGTAAAIQLAATIPNFIILETYANGVPPLRNEIFTKQPEIAGDAYPVLDSPGLGVTINEDAIARLALSAWGFRKSVAAGARMGVGGAAWIERMTPTLTKPGA